jgi:hypothetical protein
MTDIEWRPSDRRLRQFGTLCLIFSALLLARWSWHLGETSLAPQLASPAFIGAVIVSLIGTIGLFKPLVLRPIYVGWMIAAFPIGWVTTRLVLGILFYGVVAPLGVCFRVLGRDALCLKLQPETDSYWFSKEAPDDLRRYLQQF